MGPPLTNPPLPQHTNPLPSTTQLPLPSTTLPQSTNLPHPVTLTPLLLPLPPKHPLPLKKLHLLLRKHPLPSKRLLPLRRLPLPLSPLPSKLKPPSKPRLHPLLRGVTVIPLTNPKVTEATTRF